MLCAGRRQPAVAGGGRRAATGRAPRMVRSKARAPKKALSRGKTRMTRRKARTPRKALSRGKTRAPKKALSRGKKRRKMVHLERCFIFLHFTGTAPSGKNSAGPLYQLISCRQAWSVVSVCEGAYSCHLSHKG